MDEQDAWPENPSAPPPQKVSKGCGKVALIVGGLALVTLMVCCGVGGWMLWSFWPRITTNPAEVQQIAKQILDIKIPADFQPATAMSMERNFAMTMRVASFQHKERKGTLVLGSFQMKVGTPDQKPNFTQQMDQKLELQMGETKVREFQIRGQKVPFRFTEAVEQSTKKPFRVVEGNLDAPGGGTFLKLIVEEDAYDEDAVTEMIESIR